jgi:large subunit ribosomal protein L18
MKTQKRRKRQGKTDYGKRIKLLKGKHPRIVFRRSNRYVLAQYVTSKEAKDKVEVGVDSRNLKKYGWPEEFKGSLKSLPAAYLTGLLIGKKINSKKLKHPIVDLGMIKNINKNRSFAFLKGLLDSGIKIKCKEKALPSEDSIKGKHLKKDFSKIFEEIKSKIQKEK